MSTYIPPSAARDIAVQSAPSLVVLEMPGRMGFGFAAGPEGLIVTNLHVIAGAADVQALLPDGRLLVVEEVAVVDEVHDLAVLRLPTQDVPPLRLAAGSSPAEGEAVLALAPTDTGGAVAMETRVRSVQVLDGSLCVLELESDLPEGTSGTPVLDESGEVVGVATQALDDERPVTLVIPSRYVRSALEAREHLPLSTLETVSRRAAPPRQVPHHSLALLEDCPTDAIESIAATIAQAIQEGAPAYNRGDVEGCLRRYHDCAEQLMQGHPDCPGVRQALHEGLNRCDSLLEADERAWALRDTFDGLLDVIDRWLRAQAAFASVSAPRTWLQ